MNLRKVFRHLSVMVFSSLALSSCSKEKSAEIEYFAYESANGMWGMLSTDGKVLFEDEFKAAPSVARDGRFFVRTADPIRSVWEMYTASEHPKKVGSDYVYATAFRNGRALVAEQDQPVTIIDVDGKVVKKLDKIEGKEVVEVKPFNSDGYAIFETDDHMFGFIDKDGNCVLKPTYSGLASVGDGVFMAHDKKLEEQLEKAEEGGIKTVNFPFINETGKVLYELPLQDEKIAGKEYKDVELKKISEGKVPVMTEIDGEEAWGLIDLNGEVLVKPTVKIQRIGEIKGDLFTFKKDYKEWGLMNMKGETLIRAKYHEIKLDLGGKIWARFDNGKSRKWKLIDSNDNQIGEDTYEDFEPFSAIDGKHAVVKLGKNDYAIIDQNGKILDAELPARIDHILFHEGDDCVRHGSDEQRY